MLILRVSGLRDDDVLNQSFLLLLRFQPHFTITNPASLSFRPTRLSPPSHSHQNNHNHNHTPPPLAFCRHTCALSFCKT